MIHFISNCHTGQGERVLHKDRALAPAPTDAYRNAPLKLPEPTIQNQAELITAPANPSLLSTTTTANHSTRMPHEKKEIINTSAQEVQAKRRPTGRA